MTEEEAREITVTALAARREIEEHGASWDDFIGDYDDKPEYEGWEVLDWLGY